MRKSRFTEAQIVAALQEGEAGLPVAELLRKHGISRQTYYRGGPAILNRSVNWTGGLPGRSFVHRQWSPSLFGVDTLVVLRTGVTLGSGVLKRPIMDFAAPNVAYSLEEAADGDLYLQLYRVSVAGASRSRRK